MSLISELKRRNVFRVAMAYLVVGWLFLQVSDVLLDFAEAPAWIGKVIIALLALGFFLAILLSWLFEITPEGIRRDDGRATIDGVRAHRLNIVTIIAAVGVAAIFIWQQTQGPRQGSVDAPATTASSPAVEVTKDTVIDDASVAVLPFADLSPEGDQEYFSDGISEEILNVLTRVDGLAVASRTSAFAFKGKSDLGIPAIGEALKVRHVLEGSVRSAGDTIRITAQLIDAATDKHLWSQTYDRQLTAETVFAIQDEIASSIVAELANSLQLDELETEQVSVRADTNNLDAYQLFLQGRQRFRVRSVGNIPGTIEVFKQAVALDPDFARGWAGLASIAGVAPTWGIQGENEDYYVLAEMAANRAIELDDTLALPYSVLATVNRQQLPADYAYTFDMYEQALARDPRDASTWLWRGIDQMTLGFFDEAIANLDRCAELDPGYENCVVWGGLARLYAGDYQGAVAMFEEQAADNANSQTLPLALAIATNEDRLTAMLALAWAIESFDLPLEPRVVYRAMTDPNFDAEKEFQLWAEEQVALTGVVPDLTGPGILLPLVFQRFEDMRPSPQNMYWWQPNLAELRASPHRNRLIREMGIYDYWLQRGFPPQCRAVGDDDFECD